MPEPEPKAEPRLRLDRFRHTIAVYRTEENSRPKQFGDAIYSILIDGKPQFSVTEEQTGTGLREYLWLYNQLRSFGHGPVSAAKEAFQFYRLAQ